MIGHGCVRARPAAAIAVCAAMLGWSAHARADDSEDLRSATQLYDEALPLLASKDYATACPKLEQAVSLVRVAVGARLALADCYEGQGKLASGLAMAKSAHALASAANQRERVELATQRIQALSARVGHVSVKAPSDAADLPQLKIVVDGKELPRAAWNQPFAADQGGHVISASAPGRRPFEQSFSVTDGKEVSVLVPVLSELGASPPVTPQGQAEPQAEGGVMSPLRIVGITGGAVGLAAIGVGAAFGMIAMSGYDDSELGCPGNVCTQPALETRDSAYEAASVSTGMFIAGGVLLAAGVTLAIVAPNNEPQATAGAARGRKLSIRVGPGQVVTALSW